MMTSDSVRSSANTRRSVSEDRPAETPSSAAAPSALDTMLARSHRPVRIGVQRGQIRVVLVAGQQLAQAHSVDRSTTTAWSRTSISFFGGWIAPRTPAPVSMTTSQPGA